jgi:hypothetical protein
LSESAGTVIPLLARWVARSTKTEPSPNDLLRALASAMATRTYKEEEEEEEEEESLLGSFADCAGCSVAR